MESWKRQALLGKKAQFEAWFFKYIIKKIVVTRYGGKRPMTSVKCCLQILNFSKLTWNFKRFINVFGKSLLIWFLQASCYQIVSLDIEDFLCLPAESLGTMMLNYSYQWFVSHFYIRPPTQTFPKQGNKCNEENHLMPSYLCVSLIAHSRMFSPRA